MLAAPPVVATVVGLTEPDGQTSAAQTALLVRIAGHEAAGGLKAELQRSGWRSLV